MAPTTLGLMSYRHGPRDGPGPAVVRWCQRNWHHRATRADGLPWLGGRTARTGGPLLHQSTAIVFCVTACRSAECTSSLSACAPSARYRPSARVS